MQVAFVPSERPRRWIPATFRGLCLLAVQKIKNAMISSNVLKCDWKSPLQYVSRLRISLFINSWQRSGSKMEGKHPGGEMVLRRNTMICPPCLPFPQELPLQLSRESCSALLWALPFKRVQDLQISCFPTPGVTSHPKQKLLQTLAVSCLQLSECKCQRTSPVWQWSSGGVHWNVSLEGLMCGATKEVCSTTIVQLMIMSPSLPRDLQACVLSLIHRDTSICYDASHFTFGEAL